MSVKLSRIGKQSIALPAGTNCEMSIDKENNSIVVVSKGNAAKQELLLPRGLLFKSGSNKIWLEIDEELNNGKLNLKQDAGTFIKNLSNIVKGQSTLFSCDLHIDGVGYKVKVEPKYLTFSLGYSTDIKCAIPVGIVVDLGKNNQLTIKGPLKDKVMYFASFLSKGLRKYNPYTGKGIIDKRKNNLRKEVNKK